MPELLDLTGRLSHTSPVGPLWYVDRHQRSEAKSTELKAEETPAPPPAANFAGGTMRCGLCCQTAVTEWWHPDWDLERYLCGHHTHTEALPMVGAGWAQVEDWRDPHHPALPALSADPATH